MGLTPVSSDHDSTPRLEVTFNRLRRDPRSNRGNLETRNVRCVSIQRPLPSKDAVYEGVAFVDREGRTEGRTIV